MAVQRQARIQYKAPKPTRDATPAELHELSGAQYKRPTNLGNFEMYPESALRRKEEGLVIVQYTILGTGLVKDAIVVESSGSTALDSGVLKALKRWHYKPIIIEGRFINRPNLRTAFQFVLAPNSCSPDRSVQGGYDLMCVTRFRP